MKRKAEKDILKAIVASTDKVNSLLPNEYHEAKGAEARISLLNRHGNLFENLNALKSPQAKKIASLSTSELDAYILKAWYAMEVPPNNESIMHALVEASKSYPYILQLEES